MDFNTVSFRRKAMVFFLLSPNVKILFLKKVFYQMDASRMKLPAASCGVSKRNCVEAKPAFVLTCYGAVRHAIHPCSKLQGILAKANKRGRKKERVKCIGFHLQT
jgi:hypothetical protein